jgi:hypothetical protein
LGEEVNSLIDSPHCGIHKGTELSYLAEFIRQLIVVGKLEAFQNHKLELEYDVQYVEYAEYVKYTKYYKYDEYV